MSKTQKVLLVISLALFIVPEMLWSPVTNITYEFLQNSNNVQPLRNNFLINPDNITALNFVLFFQLVGVLAVSVVLFKVKKNLLGWLALFLSVILILLTACLFYLSITLGRHGIG